jgi:hypothetical protein
MSIEFRAMGRPEWEEAWNLAGYANVKQKRGKMNLPNDWGANESLG